MLYDMFGIDDVVPNMLQVICQSGFSNQQNMS